MEYFLVFIIGLCIGSFLNVCIYRLPRAKSIVRPRSFCPGCGKPVRWYDNVPVASYAVLRGKCRDCGMRISPRYPLIEIMTAVLGVVLLQRFGFVPAFFVQWIFTCALTVVTFVDLEHQEVPDVISLPGTAAGILFMTVFRLDGAAGNIASFVDSAAGAVIGGAMMFLLGAVGEMVFRKEAVGGGDVKLMAMIGAFLGWKLAVLTFFTAPVLGVGVAVFLKVKYRVEAVPYAPYLALAAFTSLMWGNRILEILFGGI